MAVRRVNTRDYRQKHQTGRSQFHVEAANGDSQPYPGPYRDDSEARTGVLRKEDCVETRLAMLSLASLEAFWFVLIHLFVFSVWMFVNTAHLKVIPHFDPFPFAMLDTVVALEAILLASFILMRQSGLAKRSDERDHLVLQILLLTEREVSAVVKMNQQMADRIGIRSIVRDEEIKEMAEPTSIDNVAQIIQEHLTGE